MFAPAALAALLVISLTALPLLGAQTTGYPGFWLYGSEYDTPHAGQPDVVSLLVDKESPCRYDGTICVKSMNTYSEPGEFVHDTGRTLCLERITLDTCVTRMINASLADRVDPLRELLLYPSEDGHSSTTMVSGVNFYGELGVGTRNPIYSPTVHKYWKLGDELYDQPIGAGRGFKNLTLVSFGFEHGFGMDGQGVLYAWGRNAYGQLGIQSREFPDGNRYNSIWPQPLVFFRPARLLLCDGGLNYLQPCAVPDDCFGIDARCVPGRYPAAARRNAWSASRMPMDPAFSSVITEFQPIGCFRYNVFMDWKTPEMDPMAECTSGGELFTWGFNMNGQLGLGEDLTTFEILPKEVKVPEEKFYSVALGAHHALASTVSGKLYAWGKNDRGQLGVPPEYMDTHCTGPDAIGECCKGKCVKPQRITGLCESLDDCLLDRRVVHVAAGEQFSVALDSFGVVWLFGDNTFGQLCQGRRVRYFGDPPVANFDALFRPRRAALPADVTIADVFVGLYHVMAVSTFGEIMAWGRNDDGQLGRGHTEHDSCHLEVKTEIPVPLEMECGREAVNGSLDLGRLHLCNLLPGNTTGLAAGERHSGAITRSNYTWRDPALKYTYGEASTQKQSFNALTGYWNDCQGEYLENCRVQGKLYRWPSTLAQVYMWGDNRFGQLGLPLEERTVTTPTLIEQFTDKDWHAIFAGSRQSFWVSRVLQCPGNCNGHGICNHDTGRCTCEFPWTMEIDCLTQWCPNNCSGQGECYPRRSVSDLVDGLRDTRTECKCESPFWDIDCRRKECPNNCWGPDHGLCNNTDGSCTCVGNATVTYTGFDCYVPDPLHVLDPLRFYTQQLLRISPFFTNGTSVTLSAAQQELLRLLATYASPAPSAPQPLPRLALALIPLVALLLPRRFRA